MSGVNQYLKEEFAKFNDRTYVSPNIDEKKLENAVNAFKYDGDKGAIIAILDETLFKSAKEGILVTGNKIIIKRSFDSPLSLGISGISEIKKAVEVSTDKKGKEKKKDYYVITHKDGFERRIEPFIYVDMNKFTTVMNEILNNFDDYTEQNQLMPLESLSEDIKVAYIKVIANMAFDDDGLVDAEEFAEIYKLITRIEMSVESRSEIRQYITSPENQENNKELVNKIIENAPDGMSQSLCISLTKDLVSVHSILTDQLSTDFPFINNLKENLNISDEELELVELAIKNDRIILNRDYKDDILVNSFKELSAKAAAIGVPLGAVYLSGSVIGLSAAGMTSGLAALGMGGFLTFSSMATGIGVAVMLGTFTYKGIKSLTKTGTEEGDKRREVMLKEIIRLGQSTMNKLSEDINFIIKDLTDAINSGNTTSEMLRKITCRISQFAEANKGLAGQLKQKEAELARLKLPETLDIDRLKAITNEQSKKVYYDKIIPFYEQNSNVDYRLISTEDIKSLIELGQIFEAIGYYSVKGAITGKLKGVLS